VVLHECDFFTEYGLFFKSCSKPSRFLLLSLVASGASSSHCPKGNFVTVSVMQVSP